MFGTIIKPPAVLETQIWNWGHNPFSKDHHTQAIVGAVSSHLPAHVQAINWLQWKAWARITGKSF